MKNIHFHRSIITGASSGLGEEFARQLADKSDEMILIARREKLLFDIAASVKKINPNILVHIRPCDLENREQIDTLANWFIHELPSSPTLLINNAGLGDYGEFTTASWERIQSMITLNMETLTLLCHSILPSIISHGGGIINISSLASALPIPDFAVYAASKSYVLSFSEALRMELKEHHINVLAVCPGPVPTQFGQVARRPGFTGNMTPCKDFFCVNKKQVVAETLVAMIKNKARIYPGSKIKWIALGIRILPMIFIRMIMGYRPRRCQSTNNQA